MMKVPILDQKPQLETLREDIIDAVTKVGDSTHYILGPEIESLEKEIAEYCGTVDAVGVSSGTDALLLSLMTLDVEPGDVRNKSAGGDKSRRLNPGVGMVVVAADAQGHDDLFERAVASPLTDAVNRAFNLTGTIFDSGHESGR